MLAFPVGRRTNWPVKPWAWQCIVDPAHPLARGFSGGWPLNDGAGSGVGGVAVGAYYDVLGRHAARPSGGVDAAMSLRGRVMSFNGSTGNIAASNFTLLPNGSGVTMACWAFSSNWTQNGMLIEKATVNASYEMFADSSGSFILRGGGTSSTLSTALPSNNAWHFIVGTIDGSNAGAIYYDGVLQASGAVNAPSDANGALNVGSYDGGAGYFFNGQIDFPMVWNRAVSAQEVLALLFDPYQFLLPKAWIFPFRAPLAAAAYVPYQPSYIVAPVMAQ